MKFLNFLPSTRLNRLQLLDIAIILAFLPHLFLLKLPMLIYLLLGLVFIIKKNDSKKIIYSFMLLGLIAIALSFVAEYNFSSFSRLLVFISLLISILTYAVILQRLTREINIYLLLSPSMLMILSFFFYNSIEMLFYALFALFSFTLLLLIEKMKSSFKAALRINLLLYLFSLPIVLLLFLVFPRISYKDASYGFKGEATKRTGHDGTMFIDSNALLVPSPRLVMEVSFNKAVPSARHLYFRGSTLYVDMGNQWVGSNIQKVKFPRLSLAKDIIEYNIKLYPHQKNWLYMLDLPMSTHKDSTIDKDYITLSKQPLFQSYQYNGRSALSYNSDIQEDSDLQKALLVDANRDPKIYTKLLKSIKKSDKDSLKARQLLAFFSGLELTYSLKPSALDMKHPVDSFLLDSKVGYCVHFASAFATCARLIGIPSRIVTGYKADRSNAINDYLLVREADAHAWVELYLKDKGWVRFEPTSTATKIITPENRGLSNSYTNTYFKDSKVSETLKQINLNYLYTRHLINKWILQYDRHKQMAILKSLLSDTIYLLKFIVSISAFILLCIALFIFLQKKRYDDPFIYEMQRLLNRLKKEGFIRIQGESMSDFLKDIEEKEKRFEGLKEINILYHEGRYAKDKGHILDQLRTKIISFIKEIKT